MTNTVDIFLKKEGDKIEMHFRGDVCLIQGWTDLWDELLCRDVTLVAYSTAFDPQPPTGVVEFTEGDLTPRMSRELDELQQKWAMLNPEIRSVIDRRMLEMIQDGKVTKKTPK